MARLNPYALKDHLRETLLFNRRLLIAAIVGAILLLGLISRLVVLQILEHERYTTRSENNRIRVEPVAPTRGLIYDRNGVLLAQNLPSFRLELVPERITDLDATLTELRALVQLSDDDIVSFRKALKGSTAFARVPLRFRLSEEEVARVAVNRHRLPGVFIAADLARHYPLGRLTAHSVGYVGRISEDELRTLDSVNYRGTHHVGKVGIEKFYEELLHGDVGSQKVETNAENRVLRVLERTLPIPGANLILNLDVELQRVAEQAFGEENGALVALDPRSGAVLAMVSMPTYDPNLFVNGLDSKTYRALRDSLDRPLFNRALQGQYAPGSTVKPFVGLAGLELDTVTTQAELDCPGWYMLEGDDRRYRDWKKQGHGEVDLKQAIIESCDVYFWDLSVALGIDSIHGYLGQFGFGQKTGVDLVGEVSGLLPSRQWKRRARALPWFPGETLNIGIGQGFMQATALQLADATIPLAQQGRRFQPYMVYAIQESDSDTQILQAAIEQPAVKVKNPDNWRYIVDSMEGVVHSIRGTARRLSVDLPYRIAGKTGTAQVFGIKQDEEYDEEKIAKRLRDHALFIAFAPIDKPEIVVAAIVENGGHGGAVAAPIVRKIMDAYLLRSKRDAS
jgi:penicillin-binding protein 2